MRQEESRSTYSIASCVFLLCANDCATSCSGIECCIASYDSLSLSTGAAAGLAANLGDGVPVRHDDEVR